MKDIKINILTSKEWQEKYYKKCYTCGKLLTSNQGKNCKECNQLKRLI
jgi:hypothetical protein